MVGFAMIILAVIFGGAALLRKKFFNMIMQSFSTVYNKHSDKQPIIKTKSWLRMAKKAGIASVLAYKMGSKTTNLNTKTKGGQGKDNNENQGSQKPNNNETAGVQQQGARQPSNNDGVNNKATEANKGKNINNATPSQPNNKQSTQVHRDREKQQSKKLDLNSAKALPPGIKQQKAPSGASHRSNHQSNIKVSDDNSNRQVQANKNPVNTQANIKHNNNYSMQSNEQQQKKPSNAPQNPNTGPPENIHYRSIQNTNHYPKKKT